MNVRNCSHSIIIELNVAEGVRQSGVLLAWGSGLGSWSLHFLDGRSRYVHNLYGKELTAVESTEVVGPGQHRIEYSFAKGEALSGVGSLFVDGIFVAKGTISRLKPSGFNGVGVGVRCGYERGPSLGTGYEAPYEFNGIILNAAVEARGALYKDPLAETVAILAEQ
ncbi:MAG: hypothetical protein M1305_07225 [Candidatus Marsarchaeota archaeon]|nr:hypothetical protein [Candidatus Marsarchaeota archaeon]